MGDMGDMGYLGCFGCWGCIGVLGGSAYAGVWRFWGLKCPVSGCMGILGLEMACAGVWGNMREIHPYEDALRNYAGVYALRFVYTRQL